MLGQNARPFVGYVTSIPIRVTAPGCGSLTGIIGAFPPLPNRAESAQLPDPQRVDHLSADWHPTCLGSRSVLNLLRSDILASAWLRGRRRAAIVVAALALVVAVARALAGNPGVVQPIAFNHRKHTQDLQLGCELCHPRVRIGAHPGLPALETCAMCHQAQQGTSAEAARVTELVTAGRPLVFVKLFRLPPHVYYTHRRHVGIADLECRNCHGDIALTTTPPRRPLVKIRMANCIACHRAQRQSTDCNACHR